MYNGKKAVMIFGAGKLQCSIIRVARENDLFTLAIDPDPYAVGKELSDRFFVLDGNDFEGTAELVSEYGIDGIVTAATDKPLLMMTRIAERFKFPFPSYNSITTTINKYLFKKALMACGLPCANGKLIRSSDDLSSLNYPIVLKPIDSSGSRGVVICDSLKQATIAIKETFKVTNSDTILVEELLLGDEISAECFVYKGEVTVVQVTDKIITRPPYNVELAHIQPSQFKRQFIVTIKQMLQKIVDYIGLDNCPLHPEFKISGDQITFIEMGPRLGGDYITSHLTPLSTGVNMEKELLKIAIGEIPVFMEQFERASMVKYIELPAGKTIKSIDVDKQLSVKKITDLFDVSLKEGFKIPPIIDSLTRYGSLVFSADTRDELNVKLSTLIEKTNESFHLC